MLWAIDQVAPDALQVMRKYLAEHGGAAAYRTEFFHGGWASENYGDKWAALDRVDQVMSYAGMDAPTQARKVVQPVDRSSSEKVRWLHQLWSGREGELDTEREAQLQRFSPNVMLLQNLKFSFIGPQTMFANVFKPDDVAGCIGQSYDRDPAEKHFARSLSPEYRIALEKNAPHHDHICAPITVYGTTRWLLYQRLIVPFRMADGREVLVVLCDPTQYINIPFLSEQSV